jgi:hypothetical protein
MFDRLDSAERMLVVLSRVLLWLALVAIVALAVVFIGTRGPGGNTQGEYYYFGAAIVLAAGWILSQFGRLRARERRATRRTSGVNLPRLAIESVEDSGPVALEDGQGFARTWEIRLGSDTSGSPEVPPDTARTFTFGRGLNVPLATLSADVVPDEATLDTIARALAQGDELDHVCAEVQPAYRGWNRLERQAYRFLIESRLAQRRGPD